VTICSHARRCVFGEIIDETVHLHPTGHIVQAVWRNLPNHFTGVALDEFIVMPNHIHAIVVLTGERAGAMNRAPTLGEVIRGFKARSSVERRKSLGDNAVLWQRNYFEHVVRNDADLSRVREYIADNPRRWAEDEENPQRVQQATR